MTTPTGRGSSATSTRTRPRSGSGAARRRARVDAVLLLYARDDGEPRGARGGADARRSERGGIERRAAPRHGRSRRRRAVRVPRRDLAAVRRGPLARRGRPRRPSAPASSCSATRTSTASTPTGRCSTRPTTREGTLPRDADGSGRADLGRNGSYLVFRQLRQDVAGFWRFVDAATRRARREQRPERARVRLAAKMVGRWPSGAPLTLSPDADDPALAEANDFAYHEHDRRGTRCPIGSHIRRTNPRDSLDPRPGSDRLVGGEPPPPPPPARARVRAAAAARRGARGRRRGRARPALRLPQRQHRAPVRVRPPHLDEQPEVRPALRRRRPARRAVGATRRTFTIPTEGVRERVTDIPRFVSVKGGAYFFLPGLAALRYLARLEPGKTSSPVGS